MVAQNCTPTVAQSDLNINQVSAKLLSGGSLWWDLSDGSYIVPKSSGISAIFAAGIWIGGYDSGGNLKTAGQTYRQAGNDFWAGPIVDGVVDDCGVWDRHYTVFGAEIDSLRLDCSDNGEINLPIPTSLLQWPGRGNPHYANYFGHELPNQELAPFHDENSDGIYDPMDGDYPILGLDGCDQSYADQMVWWVFNDVGNVHTETNGQPLSVEIQVMAYAFNRENLNYATFYNYEVINKGLDTLFDLYFTQFADVDLGCWEDDLVGCNVNRSLGIAYNGNTPDSPCSTFSQLIPSYGDTIPLLGIDFLNTPTPNDGSPGGMSSFVYYENNHSPKGLPVQPIEYYNLMRGKWKTGAPIEYGGDGYQQGTATTTYMFPNDPSSGTGWSECSENRAPDDRRFLMSAGPFNLHPSERKEVSLGVLFVPDVPHPCPSFQPMLDHSDWVQSIFENCFNTDTTSFEKPTETIGEISLYPNPANRGEQITINNVPPNTFLEVWSSDGKMVKVVQSDLGEHALALVIEQSVASTIYFVVVKSEEERIAVFKLYYSE